MSHIGEQLIAPDGFSSLIANRAYYFLGRYGGCEYTHLCFFESDPPRAHIEKIRNSTFDDAIKKGSLVSVEKPKTLPPWLNRLEGKDLEKLNEKTRNKRKISDEERVDKSYEDIEHLLPHETEIFSSDDPKNKINQITREVYGRSKNVTRIRLSYLCYLCFGRTKWALLPAFCNAGHWEREQLDPDVKMGRHNRSKGTKSGYPVNDDMKETIYDGYRKFAKTGALLSKIYEDALLKLFKCKSRKVKNNRKEIYHPEGRPFPSFWQFRYWVYKKFGKKNVHIRLYGEARVRNRKSPSKGKYTEKLSNLLERVEVDAYYLKEVPKGFIEGEHMPPLCVVRLIDRLTSYRVGIGFSIGAETADAYRSALFSMAVDKVLFCSLYGMEIEPEEWESVGMPSWLTFDRGPAAILNLVRDPDVVIPVREFTPSYSGQSKATVEASHPRDRKLEGKPTFIESKLNYLELMQREILRCLKENQSSNVAPKTPIELTKARKMPTPEELWRHYDKGRRTNAYQISFDTAVKSFLPELEFSVGEDGIYLYGSRFDSKALKKTGIYDRAMSDNAPKIKGYALMMALRQVWTSVEGKLIKANAVPAIRVNEKDLYIPLEELRQLHEIRKDIESDFREHRIAVSMELRDRFKQITGKTWDIGTLKAGRSRKNKPTARKEFLDIKQITSVGDIS